VWAGVDSAWEQEKLEARKMLENAAESHTSGARFVGWRCITATQFYEEPCSVSITDAIERSFTFLSSLSNLSRSHFCSPFATLNRLKTE
jgi:hypothetical protein